MTENKPTFVLYFIKLIKQLRPTATTDLKGATINILNVINELEENAEKLRIYQEQCQQLLISTDIQEIFTDSNDVFGSTSVLNNYQKTLNTVFYLPLWKNHLLYICSKKFLIKNGLYLGKCPTEGVLGALV